MTREQFADLIRWSWIIWLMGFVNVGAMIPQLRTIRRTKSAEGLDPRMFWIYFAVQVAFSLNGYFKHDAVLMWCMGLSAAVSAVILGHVYQYQR